MGSVISQSPSPPFVFSLIVSIPSIILYCIEVVILLINIKYFNTAFFRLFIVRFIYNFLNYFNSFFYARFGRVGLFLYLFERIPSWLLAFFFFFHYYNFHVDNLFTMFILLNRLTLITFPMTHEKIWKYFLPISILLTIGVPLPFTIPTLSNTFYVRMQDDNTTFTLDYYRETGKTYLKSSYISAISAISFCIVCGILNCLTVFFYRRANKQQLRAPSNLSARNMEEQKIEMRLTIYAVITFLAQLCMAIYMLTIYISSSTGPWALDNVFYAALNQFCWINDVSTVILPSLPLLWASSKVRDLMFETLKVHSWPLISRSTNPNLQNTIVVLSNSALSHEIGSNKYK
ncbi:srg family chemoreceptor domain-containing protein [Ditylenchus destructor]|nr:srg family chemoreceptor domain-containing protein [Ditylenchus destructor]